MMFEVQTNVDGTWKVQWNEETFTTAKEAQQEIVDFVAECEASADMLPEPLPKVENFRVVPISPCLSQ